MPYTPAHSFSSRRRGRPDSALSSPFCFDWFDTLFNLNPGIDVSKAKTYVEQRCRGRQESSTSQSTTNTRTVSTTAHTVLGNGRSPVSNGCGPAALKTAVGGAHENAASGRGGRETLSEFAHKVFSPMGKSSCLGRRLTGRRADLCGVTNSHKLEQARIRQRTRASVCTVVLVVILLAPPAASARLPVIYNGLLGYAHVSATASPPGANNFACKPSTAHPQPVVLVHGTFEDMADNWQALSPLLADNGYCVFALNYGSYDGSGALGIYATGDIAQSAQQLARFVTRVLAATGARKVDLVGHSQGGMMPRYYIKFLGGATRVNALVGLAPSNHGTTLDGLFTLTSFFPGASALLGALCPACAEQKSGSPFLTQLNASGDTVPGIKYTVIQSSNDEVCDPPSISAFLSGPDVTNILLQKQCPLDHGEHLSMPYDHIADADVLTALDPGHPQHPACTPVLPIIGG